MVVGVVVEDDAQRPRIARTVVEKAARFGVERLSGGENMPLTLRDQQRQDTALPMQYEPIDDRSPNADGHHPLFGHQDDRVDLVQRSARHPLAQALALKARIIPALQVARHPLVRESRPNARHRDHHADRKTHLRRVSDLKASVRQRNDREQCPTNDAAKNHDVVPQRWSKNKPVVLSVEPPTQECPPIPLLAGRQIPKRRFKPRPLLVHSSIQPQSEVRTNLIAPAFLPVWGGYSPSWGP